MSLATAPAAIFGGVNVIPEDKSRPNSAGRNCSKRYGALTAPETPRPPIT